MSWKTLLALLVFASTCEPTFASNDGTVLRPFVHSTNAVGVARRQTACSSGYDEGFSTDPSYVNIYDCSGRGYTQVPNTEWIATTTYMYELSLPVSCFLFPLFFFLFSLSSFLFPLSSFFSPLSSFLFPFGCTIKPVVQPICRLYLLKLQLTQNIIRQPQSFFTLLVFISVVLIHVFDVEFVC